MMMKIKYVYLGIDRIRTNQMRRVTSAIMTQAERRQLEDVIRGKLKKTIKYVCFIESLAFVW